MERHMVVAPVYRELSGLGQWKDLFRTWIRVAGMTAILTTPSDVAPKREEHTKHSYSASYPLVNKGGDPHSAWYLS
jgi:hypothetical protein